MHELYDHQREGLDLLLQNDGYALFWECGVGKTLPAARAADIRLQSGDIDTLIVLCPKAAMWNWVKEMSTNTEYFRRAVVLDGDRDEREKELEATLNYSHTVLVTNYAKLRLHEDEFTRLVTSRDVMIIFDESHYIKNWEAERTKQAVALADEAKYVVLLTGTPIGKDISDIWSQYRALDGGQTFGSNYYKFRRMYMQSVPNVPGMWKPNSEGNQAVRDMMWERADLKRKEDCLDLPSVRFDKYWIDLPPKTKKVYKKLSDALIAEFEAADGEMSQVEAANAAVATMKLQQITSGFAIDDEGELKELDAQPKLDALKQIVSELPKHEKVVVWARFLRDIRKIKEELEEWHPLSIESSHDAEERQDTIELFQADNEHKVMVSNPQCGGAAITLTRANVAIYYSNSYNYIDRRQSLDRIHRIGQGRKVRYVDIVADGTVDVSVIEALGQRKDLVDFLRETAISDIVKGKVKHSGEEGADVQFQRGEQREGKLRGAGGRDYEAVKAATEADVKAYQRELDFESEGGGRGEVKRLPVGGPRSSDGEGPSGGAGEGLPEHPRQEGRAEGADEDSRGAFEGPRRTDVATFDGSW